MVEEIKNQFKQSLTQARTDVKWDSSSVLH